MNAVKTKKLTIYNAVGASALLGLDRNSFLKRRMSGLIVEPGIHIEVDGEVSHYWDKEQILDNVLKDVVYPNMISKRALAKYVGINPSTLRKKLDRGDAGDPVISIRLNDVEKRPLEYWIKDYTLIQKLQSKSSVSIAAAKKRREEENGGKVARIKREIIAGIYVRGYEDAVFECRKELAEKYRDGHLQCERCSEKS